MGFLKLPTQEDYDFAKNCCRNTDNKDFTDNHATKEFIRKLLISEHSPIREIVVKWKWDGIKSWVATHWSRHKFECYISTQRADRTRKDRDDAPQKAPVTFVGSANAQNLIDVMRKRLCFQASKETRDLAYNFKAGLNSMGQQDLADVLVPNCIYRMGCPEFKGCGLFDSFIRWCNFNYDEYDLTDIDTRYKLFRVFLEEREDMI